MWERMGTSCAPSLQAMARVCQCSCLDFSCLKVNDLTTKEFCQVLTISLFFQPVQSLLWCRYSQLKVNCWLSVVVTAFLVVKLYLSSLSDRSPHDVMETPLPCKRSHLKRETRHLNLVKISQNCENQQFRIPPKIRNSRLWEIRVIVQASILLLGRGGEPVLIYTDCRK